jgi:L-asparaginase
MVPRTTRLRIIENLRKESRPGTDECRERKASYTTFGCVALLAALAVSRASTAELPHVHLLATGGTISGGQQPLDAAGLAALVPGVSLVARVTMEDVTRVGSSRMTPELQFRLATRVNDLLAADSDLAGIVITHGTDTLEETAFLLELLVTSDRPVVFAAAQRPPRDADTDGPRNLLNAFRIAASPQARGLGVLVTLNDEVHSARYVRKTHAIALDAFQSPWVGPVGYVDAGRLVVTRGRAARVTLAPPRVESRIDLITLTAGSDGHLIRAAVDAGARGIVVEVFGRGNVPPAAMDAVKAARDSGVVVVFTTRTRGGRVELDEAALKLGVVGGEDLDGFKARMLLVAALGAGADGPAIQNLVERLAGQGR